MPKTKLESSFSSRRLATRVLEVVFGRWVLIHFFFAFCRTCRGSTITFQCFWLFFEIKDIFLTVVDEIGAFYSLKNFLLFYSHGVSWNHDRWKSNVSKHLLLIFMFIWSQTEYCRKSDVLQRSRELGFRLRCKLWLGLVLAGTSKLMCLRACVLGKTGLQNHSKMQAVSRGLFKVLLKVYERRTNSYQ